MGRLQWGRAGGDSALAALVVGGIAVALGGAALFGMVAHTWTPFLPQRGAGLSPFDAVARAGPVRPAAALKPVERKRPSSIPFDPRPDEFDTVEAGPTPAPRLATLPSPLAEATAPPDSLSPRESVVVHDGPASFLDPQPVVIRVADVKVVGAKRGKPTKTEVRLVEYSPVEMRVTTKPVEPGPVEPVPAESKPAEARRQPRPDPPKVAEARRPEPKTAPARIAEPKRVASRPAEPRAAATKPAATKPAATRVAEAKRIQARAIPLKVAAVKAAGTGGRAGPIRVADTRAAEARRAAEAKAAETKLAEAKLAEAKRAAEAKAAQARLAEARRAQEARAEEARLAEARRAAEIKAAEARLAESQRAFEMEAAEARLAETKRALETTLAEARLAEAKLAETKRAVDMTVAMARPPVVKHAVETKPAPPRYEQCDRCGIVASVRPRYGDGGAISWEVRVEFREGADRVFFYPTDPGLSIGERVLFEGGRITRRYPRRAAPYSPA